MGVMARPNGITGCGIGAGRCGGGHGVTIVRVLHRDPGRGRRGRAPAGTGGRRVDRRGRGTRGSTRGRFSAQGLRGAAARQRIRSGVQTRSTQSTSSRNGACPARSKPMLPRQRRLLAAPPSSTPLNPLIHDSMMLVKTSSMDKAVHRCFTVQLFDFRLRTGSPAPLRGV